ncbi:MAG TPA: hypothetical protein VFY92_05180 [Hyphomicrobiaceae bacterium]|nr:hypothetical protein [Hyphomicrobiaceae bacterium]
MTRINVDLSDFGICRSIGEEKDRAMHTPMPATEIQDYARQLAEAHGDRAPVVAAQRAMALEQAGDSEQAEDWRRIERALLLMRGARQQ